jgi:hypothetical protein
VQAPAGVPHADLETIMQRVAGQYVVKKFADQLLGSEEKQAQQAGGTPEQQPQPQYAAQPTGVQQSGGELNGSMVYDDEGNRLGIARHVAEVSVYLISHNAAELNRNLQQTIMDPDMELRLSTDGNGRVTGLIYVPASARAAQNIPGIRSDDI